MPVAPPVQGVLYSKEVLGRLKSSVAKVYAVTPPKRNYRLALRLASLIRAYKRDGCKVAYRTNSCALTGYVFPVLRLGSFIRGIADSAHSYPLGTIAVANEPNSRVNVRISLP